MKEYYVDCNLYFRDVMEINEEINYNIKTIHSLKLLLFLQSRIRRMKLL